MPFERDYEHDAIALMRGWGVQRSDHDTWSFTDVRTASTAYVHHSSWPAAICAYAAVDPIFGAGRKPGYTLIDLAHGIPRMDGAEKTAMAITCGALPPDFGTYARKGGAAKRFGEMAWLIVKTYALDGCFMEVPAYGTEGAHFRMRPRGFDWSTHKPLQDDLKAMRRAYKAMAPLQQVMTLSLLHLYRSNTDTTFLIGGCPTKILAADALTILRDDGEALVHWGELMSNYSGW